MVWALAVFGSWMIILVLLSDSSDEEAIIVETIIESQNTEWVLCTWWYVKFCLLDEFLCFLRLLSTPFVF